MTDEAAIRAAVLARLERLGMRDAADRADPVSRWDVLSVLVFSSFAAVAAWLLWNDVFPPDILRRCFFAALLGLGAAAGFASVVVAAVIAAVLRMRARGGEGHDV